MGIAEFDQAYAQVRDQLDDLIAAWRSTVAEAAAPREVDLAGMGVWLRDNADVEALAELLAVAIDRLERGGGP